MIKGNSAKLVNIPIGIYGLTCLKKYGEDLSYILGVCDGDGCVWKENIKRPLVLKWNLNGGITKTYCIELKVKDKSFVEAFMMSFIKVTKRPSRRKKKSIFSDKRKFWRVVMRNRAFGEFYYNTNWKDIVRKYPKGYLRGFYDSEGNLSFNKDKRNIEYPIIRMFNTEIDKVNFVSELMNLLKIKHKVKIFRKSGVITNYSKNTKNLYVIQSNCNNAKKFLRIVGTNIRRKMK